jgi:hypothetical protein
LAIWTRQRLSTRSSWAAKASAIRERGTISTDGIILAVLDPTAGGLTPTPGPKSLYFSVPDLDAVHKRATDLKALAPYRVHGQPAADAIKRPWGERSFYVVDNWGNDLCFVEDGTQYNTPPSRCRNSSSWRESASPRKLFWIACASADGETISC